MGYKYVTLLMDGSLKPENLASELRRAVGGYDYLTMEVFTTLTFSVALSLKSSSGGRWVWVRVRDFATSGYAPWRFSILVGSVGCLARRQAQSPYR